MSIRHLDDGRFQVVNPMFFRWPAKNVILSSFLANAVVSIVLLLLSTNTFAFLLLSSILLSALFAVGYDRESFIAIYMHLSFCIIIILAFTAVIPTVYFDPTLCSGSSNCRKMSIWMKNIGFPINSFWAYFYASVTIISHILMTPPSFLMMKYTAACKALEKMLRDEEFAKRFKIPEIPDQSLPIYI